MRKVICLIFAASFLLMAPAIGRAQVGVPVTNPGRDNADRTRANRERNRRDLEDAQQELRMLDRVKDASRNTVDPERIHQKEIAENIKQLNKESDELLMAVKAPGE